MSAKFFKDIYSDWKINAPELHIVLGSGLSFAFAEIDRSKEWKEIAQLKFSAVPSFPAASIEGHPGVFRYYQHLKTGKSICFQAGRIHGYEGHSPRDVVKALLWLKQAGTSKFLLTNAAGSLNRNFLPGSVMLISDHVNLTGQNPLIGPNPVGDDGRPLGPRFPDLSEVYDKNLRKQLNEICVARGLKVHEGIYLGLMGSSYETPSEVALYSSWGLGAVGMSTVWEAIALKHAGATVCGLSMISNLGCGLSEQPLSHSEVEDTGRRVGRQILETLFDFAGNYVRNI